MSAIKVLAAARQTDPSAFDRAEPQLLEAARVHAIGDLQRVVGFWRQQIDHAHDLRGDDAARAWRRLHASAPYLGMVRVDGDLDPENGEALLTALGAVLDAETRSQTAEDDRTPRAAARGRAGRDLPAVARPLGQADGRRRTTSRHAHGRRRDAGRSCGRDRGARPHGRRPRGDREATPVRCLRHARRALGSFPTDGRGPADADRPSGDATSRDRARSSLPVPGLRSAAQLVRCASHRALGRRRTDRGNGSPLAVPSASSDGACARRVQVGAARRPPRVQAPGRIAVGGPSAAATY
jgi:hypothetical protein